MKKEKTQIIKSEMKVGRLLPVTEIKKKKYENTVNNCKPTHQKNFFFKKKHQFSKIYPPKMNKEHVTTHLMRQALPQCQKQTKSS